MATIDRRGNVVGATDAPAVTTPNAGLAYKTPARVATTAAIALSGLQTLDGIALNAGDRVLVKNQADTTTNGLYNASSGNWTRTADANDNSELVNGCQVFVGFGTLNAKTIWALQDTDPVLLGTSALTFGQSAFSGVLTANALVIGGGAGVAPSTIGSLGSVTQVLHGNASGPPAFAPIAGVDLPNPSPTTLGAVFASVAVAGQYISSINSDGTASQSAIAALAAAFTVGGVTYGGTSGGLNIFKGSDGHSAIVSGGAGSANTYQASGGHTFYNFNGTVHYYDILANQQLIYGTTSGVITLLNQTAAGTYTWGWPTTAGSAGQPLLSGGGGGAAQTYGTLGVAGGGTGAATLTSHGVLVGAGTGTVVATSAGTDKKVLTGVSSGDPTFQVAGWTLIEVLTASSSASLTTSTFTSDYDDYAFVFDNIVPATDSVNFNATVESAASFQATTYLNATALTTAIDLETVSTISNSAGRGYNGTIFFNNVNSTSVNKFMTGRGVFALTGTFVPTSINVAGYWNGGQGAITRVRFQMSSGNISTGSIKVFGLRAS